MSGVTSPLLADFSRDNATGIVTDNITTLQWLDEPFTTNRTWAVAITYCEGLTVGGFDNWRLPNINELYSIVDHSLFTPALAPTFMNIVGVRHWSATTITSSNLSFKDMAFVVDMGDGDNAQTSKGLALRTLCVREVP